MNNNEIREMFRIIYCMNYSDWNDLMEFNDEAYSIRKFQQVQSDLSMSLVRDLDIKHSNLLINWARVQLKDREQMF